LEFHADGVFEGVGDDLSGGMIEVSPMLMLRTEHSETKTEQVSVADIYKDSMSQHITADEALNVLALEWSL
jgi:hypothetical protein